MSTILLAVGDAALREACRRQLQAAGHAPLALDRPLAALSLAARLRWDLSIVDASAFGHEARTALAGCTSAAPIIDLGAQDAARTSLALPLDGRDLLLAVEAALQREAGQRSFGPLHLDAAHRVATAHGQDVALTRTEFRLLEVLAERYPTEVPLPELLDAVWGFADGSGASVLVRAHARNLRAKLAAIGLINAVVARRGRGYALSL